MEASGGPVGDSATCIVTAVFASCPLLCPVTDSWNEALSVSTSGSGITRAGSGGIGSGVTSRSEISCLPAVRVKPAPDALNLYVEDSGIGIPREKLGRIGRPFEQVESDLIRSHGGSGLGLAIARSLAELHGGSLRIRSIMGSGTIVMVHLPLKSPAGAELEQAA